MPGDTAHKRTKLQREMDRVEVVRLVRRGWSFRRIAAHIGKNYPGGLTWKLIQQDYHICLKEMSDDYRANKKYCRVMKLQELEEIKEEARQAWDYANGRFLESVIYQVLTAVDRAKEAGEPIPTTFEISTKSLPDNNYLLTILKALGIEMDLYGLKQKKKVDKSRNTTIQFNWDMLSGATPGTVVDEIEARIASITSLAPQSTDNVDPQSSNIRNGAQSDNFVAPGFQQPSGEESDNGDEE